MLLDIRLVGSSRLMPNIRIVEGWPLRCSVMLRMVSSSSLWPVSICLGPCLFIVHLVISSMY
jgi:hypothetical protein